MSIPINSMASIYLVPVFFWPINDYSIIIGFGNILNHAIIIQTWHRKIFVRSLFRKNDRRIIFFSEFEIYQINPVDQNLVWSPQTKFPQASGQASWQAYARGPARGRKIMISWPAGPGLSPGPGVPQARPRDRRTPGHLRFSKYTGVFGTLDLRTHLKSCVFERFGQNFGKMLWEA